MNKSEHRHQLIRALITKNKIHTQAELQALLAKNDIQVTQATLSRDIKNMNLSKVREEDSAYYVLNNGSISKWEKRLELYMEDALVWMRPVQHQVLLKTLPGLAQSFGSIIDTLSFPDAIATLCGNDVCLIICEDADTAQKCFEELKKFAPPFFVFYFFKIKVALLLITRSTNIVVQVSTLKFINHLTTDTVF